MKNATLKNSYVGVNKLSIPIYQKNVELSESTKKAFKKNIQNEVLNLAFVIVPCIIFSVVMYFAVFY